MIALGVSQALEGVATSATTVTYTISGLLMSSASPPVATGYEILAQGQLAASAGSIYNPGGSATALISNIVLFNTGGSAQTVSLYAEGTAAANQIYTGSIPAGGFAQYDGDGWTMYTSNGVPVSGSGLTSVSSYISSTVSLTATTFINVTSISLTPGTWLIVGSVLAHLTTATLGHMDVFLGPNTASKTSAYVAASASMGDIAGGTEEDTCSVVTVQTFTTTTTVYLEAYCSEASTAENISNQQSIANTTGILAIKIG